MVGMLPEAMVIDQVKEGQLQILETDLIFRCPRLWNFDT